MNELSILAKRRKIPILTGNQLNREAYRALNEGAEAQGNSNSKSKGKMDQGRKIDPSMISESQLLIENCDVAFAQHREEVNTGEVYITFKKLKDRSSKSHKLASNEYFVHPFMTGNGMRLVEDYFEDESASMDSVQDLFSFSGKDDDYFEDDSDDDSFDESTTSGKGGKKGASFKRTSVV